MNTVRAVSLYLLRRWAFSSPGSPFFAYDGFETLTVDCSAVFCLPHSRQKMDHGNAENSQTGSISFVGCTENGLAGNKIIRIKLFSMGSKPGNPL